MGEGAPVPPPPQEAVQAPAHAPEAHVATAGAAPEQASAAAGDSQQDAEAGQAVQVEPAIQPAPVAPDAGIQPAETAPAAVQAVAAEPAAVAPDQDPAQLAAATGPATPAAPAAPITLQNPSGVLSPDSAAATEPDQPEPDAEPDPDADIETAEQKRQRNNAAALRTLEEVRGIAVDGIIKPEAAAASLGALSGGEAMRRIQAAYDLVRQSPENDTNKRKAIGILSEMQKRATASEVENLDKGIARTIESTKSAEDPRTQILGYDFDIAFQERSQADTLKYIADRRAALGTNITDKDREDFQAIIDKDAAEMEKLRAKRAAIADKLKEETGQDTPNQVQALAIELVGGAAAFEGEEPTSEQLKLAERIKKEPLTIILSELGASTVNEEANKNLKKNMTRAFQSKDASLTDAQKAADAKSAELRAEQFAQAIFIEASGFKLDGMDIALGFWALFQWFEELMKKSESGQG